MNFITRKALILKRVFAAIKVNPSESLLATYFQLKNAFKEDKIKWVEPDNFHLTLKFIGNSTEEEIIKIESVLEKLASTVNPFRFLLSKLGVFGSSYAPRVIWAGTNGEMKLQRLYELSIEAFENAGWERTRQNIVPHLTLARIKNIRDKKRFTSLVEEMNKLVDETIEVNEILLYESILQPSGPKYQLINSFQLNADVSSE